MLTILVHRPRAQAIERYTELNNAMQAAAHTVYQKPSLFTMLTSAFSSTLDPAIISAAMKRKRQYRPRVSQNRPRTSPNRPRTSHTVTPARPGAVMDINMTAIAQHR